MTKQSFVVALFKNDYLAGLSRLPLLAVIVVALLWAVLARRIVLAGVLLGFAVHFKIYPFIYAASVFWWLGGNNGWDRSLVGRLLSVITRDRMVLAVTSLATFMSLNVVMYKAYVKPQAKNMGSLANNTTDTAGHSSSTATSIT